MKWLKVIIFIVHGAPHAPASWPPQAMPEQDRVEGHSMTEGSVIVPLACPQAHTHTHNCFAATFCLSADATAIKMHGNKQCGGDTRCGFFLGGGDGGLVTTL